MSKTPISTRQVSDRFRPEEIDACLLEYNSATTIPPRFYNDPAIFELEKERVLKTSWFPVGHVSEVSAPGDYFTVDFCEEPVLVIRDRNDELHALSNVCIHRNFPVAHDRGNCALLRCRYHNWVYNLDGSLRGAPLMENAKDFSAKDWRLHEFHLEVWRGFIFVNMKRGPVASLAPRLTGLEQIFLRHETDNMVYFQMGEFDLEANWKCVVDIFAENYHTDAVHEKSLGDSVPAGKTIIENTDMPAYCMFRLPSGGGADLQNPDDYALTGGFALPGSLDESDMNVAVGGIVFPNFSWYFNPDLIFVTQMDPQTHNRTTGRYGIGISREAAEAPDFMDKFEAYKQNAKLVIDEDFWSITEMYRGKRSAFAAQGRTSHAEATLWHFHKWYIETLRAAAPGMFEA